MKAIVLTFDKYRALTWHMIAAYAELWPGHPLRFRIPFQTLELPERPDIEPVRSLPGIKETVLTLLDDLPDDDWIYWCIDDKYPIHGEFGRFAEIAQWLPAIDDPAISGILLCRCRGLLGDRALAGPAIPAPWGEPLLERAGYHQLWLHQFLRVKVLRHVFRSFPDAIPAAKALDELLSRLEKPAGHRLFVAARNLSVFGESTSRGLLTQNCYFSMKTRGLPRPDFFDGRLAPAIVMGGA